MLASFALLVAILASAVLWSERESESLWKPGEDFVKPINVLPNHDKNQY